MKHDQLKRFIKYVILEERGKAPPDFIGSGTGEYGKYLFAPQRIEHGDDSVPPEENTPSEEAIAVALNQHYFGRHDAINNLIDNIKDNSENYPQFLLPPRRYKNAYRTMTVAPDVMERVFGIKLTQDDMDGQVHTISNNAVLGPFRGRKAFSWTLDPGILFGLLKDWGSFFHTDWVSKRIPSGGFVILISAPVQGNNFVLNPFMIKKTGLAGKFDYEMEVLSTGNVTINAISYFYFTPDSDPSMETELLRNMINSI